MKLLIPLFSLLVIPLIAQSQVITDSLFSHALNTQKEFKVFHPNQETPTTLIIVLDGHKHFDIVKSTVEYLSDNEQMPFATVVSLRGNPRDIDFTPVPWAMSENSDIVGGGGPSFLAFIKDELMPYLEEKYEINSNRTLIGHSLGGLFSMNALLQSPSTFTNYVAISPTLVWAEEYTLKLMERTLDSIDFKGKNLIYSRGNPLNSEEYRNATFETLPDCLYIKKVERIIKESGTKLNPKYFYYPNYNHINETPTALTDALTSLFDFYPLNTEEVASFFNESPEEFVNYIDNHFKNVSDKLGYQVLPKEEYLRGYAGFIERFMKDKLPFAEALKEKAELLYPPEK